MSVQESIQRILAVTPMCVGIGEPVVLKVKICGDIKIIDNLSNYCSTTPRLKTWSNKAPRGSHFLDDTIDGWSGTLDLDTNGALEGPTSITFDGIHQGTFPGDQRAIRVFDGWHWTRPGIHHIRLTDRESGFTAISNPIIVTETIPENRAYFGDIHWQTYFTDGLRNPEELYYYAKDEGFLDFGAITDHSEGITDRQWDYMCAVTEDFNIPGEFSTLIGEEWTSFAPSHCGHRNIYYRDGQRRPIYRSTDEHYDDIDKLYDTLKEEEAMAIPHHSSNIIMGVNWDAGHDPRLEPAVEIYSCWGSSELSKEDGNIAPLLAEGGTTPGQYIRDALRRGRRFGFVGGGDIHCGRPGDSFNQTCWTKKDGSGTEFHHQYVAGFTCASLPQNTRENIYDAIQNRATWVTTQQRYYLEYTIDGCNMGSQIVNGTGIHQLHILCVSNEDIVDCRLLSAYGEVAVFHPDPANPLILRIDTDLSLEKGVYYPRITTVGGNMAWASPIWIAKED
ncbi:MAG: DUF3604 domain-containing protein [Ruminococcaceae bacterium]|nr:DUF3604 domain-containing protein [Oscillospiraceae bacterium]